MLLWMAIMVRSRNRIRSIQPQASVGGDGLRFRSHSSSDNEVRVPLRGSDTSFTQKKRGVGMRFGHLLIAELPFEPTSPAQRIVSERVPIRNAQ